MKNINLKDFKCLKLNPNLMVWDLTNDPPELIPNIGGFGAILTAEIEHGVVTNIEVNFGGEGHTNNTTIVITNDGDEGFGATATAEIDNGVITKINIVNGGSKYELIPIVTVNDSTHENIAANVIIRTEQPFNPYTKTIVNSTSTISTYNVPNKTAILSFYDCSILYNDLHTYQELVSQFCILCNDGGFNDMMSIGNISTYINSIENWCYKEGNYLYPYLHYLFTEDFIEEYEFGQQIFVFYPLEYYKPKTTDNNTEKFISFLEFITNSGKSIIIDVFGENFNISLSLHRLTQTTTLNNNLHTFVVEYVLSNNKLQLINDLIYSYVISLDEINDKIQQIKTYDITSDIRSQCFNFVFETAKEYVIMNHSCDSIQITKEYEYTISDFDNTPPKIKLPIILNSNINDIGIMSKPVEYWEPGKRYYKNDLVMFDGYTYILKNDNNGEGFTGVFNPLDNVIYFDEFYSTENKVIVEPLIIEFICNSGGSGARARVTVNTGNSTISTILLDYGGIGYDVNNPPIVKIIGGGGTGATAVVRSNHIVSGVITGIEIINRGTGYSKNTGHFKEYIIHNETGDYNHWKITVGKNYRKIKIKNEGDSLLYTLRSYRPKEEFISWFDVEGVYQDKHVLGSGAAPILYYNIEPIDNTTYYRSYIESITYTNYNEEGQETNYIENTIVPDEWVWNNGQPFERKVVYEYIINEIGRGNSIIVEGVKYTDTITTELISNADEWSEPSIVTEIEYSTFYFQDPKYPMVGNNATDYSLMRFNGEISSMIYNTNINNESPIINRYEHLNKELWEYTSLIKEEHLFGINGGEPYVEDNISVERGITYSFDKHCAFGEIKTFEQFLSYNNGSFWKIYDNSKKVEE